MATITPDDGIKLLEAEEVDNIIEENNEVNRRLKEIFLGGEMDD